MYRVYLAAVDIVPAAIVLIPMFGVLYGCASYFDRRKSVLYCLFCLYLSAVFSLVGIPNVTYYRPELNLNLVPFDGMIGDLTNSILNVVLFIPLGLFLPVQWEPFRKLLPCTVYGFGLSLSIELLQILTFRATDVNDIITNVTGCVLGFLLAKPLTSRFEAVGRGSRDAYLMSILSFGIVFFIHPFLSPFIWDRIL
jgi:glycopeptide antibiotics resistance protein